MNAGHQAREPADRSRRTALGAVLAVGAAGLLLGATLLLSQSAPRRAESNGQLDAGPAVTLLPGQELCQPGELVPADTAAIRLDATPRGASRGPALEAELREAAAPHTAGALAGGWRAGRISIPLAPHVRRNLGATVCVRDQGPSAAAFGGSLPAAGWLLYVGGRGLSVRTRIDYLRPGSESWFSLVPVLGHRLTLGKSPLIRHLAPVAAIVLALLAAALGAYTVFAAGTRA